MNDNANATEQAICCIFTEMGIPTQMVRRQHGYCIAARVPPLIDSGPDDRKANVYTMHVYGDNNIDIGTATGWYLRTFYLDDEDVFAQIATYLQTRPDANDNLPIRYALTLGDMTINWIVTVKKFGTVLRKRKPNVKRPPGHCRRPDDCPRGA